MCKYERKSRQLVVTIFLVASVLYWGWILVEYMMKARVPDLSMVMEWLILLVISLWVIWVLPPDFKYRLMATKEYVTIEVPKIEPITIRKENMTVKRDGRGYLMLDDGNTKMRIAYNPEVYDLLCGRYDYWSKK